MGPTRRFELSFGPSALPKRYFNRSIFHIVTAYMVQRKIYRTLIFGSERVLRFYGSGLEHRSPFCFMVNLLLNTSAA